MKKVTIVLQDSSPPQVTFDGDYVTKRELGLLMRAVKREHIRVVKDYRRKLIIEEYEKEKLKGQNYVGTKPSGTASTAATGATVARAKV